MNHIHCLGGSFFYHNHLIGIFSGQSYEMTRIIAKLCECSDWLFVVLVMTELYTSTPLSQPSDQNTVMSIKCMIFHAIVTVVPNINCICFSPTVDNMTQF